MSNILQKMAQIDIFSADEIFAEQSVFCFKAVEFNARAVLFDGRGNMVYVPCNRNRQPIDVNLKGKIELIDYVETHGVIFECHPLELDIWEKHSTIRNLYVCDVSLEERIEYAKKMEVVLDLIRPYDPIRLEDLRYMAVGNYCSV